MENSRWKKIREIVNFQIKFEMIFEIIFSDIIEIVRHITHTFPGHKREGT